MKLTLYDRWNIQSHRYFTSLPLYYKDYFNTMSQVIEFRTNNYVLENLIDWSHALEDELFKVTFFPYEGIESTLWKENISQAVKNNENCIITIRKMLNPDSEQSTKDIPELNGEVLNGLQHRYEDICLVFPKQGQQCHAYCTFCFRWPQFIKEAQFHKHQVENYDLCLEYIKNNKQIHELLFTGGDVLMLSTDVLRRYIIPLLSKEFEHIKTIRFGTKALAFWPFRFTDGKDADNLLILLETIIRAGKRAIVIAHYNHPREMEPQIAEKALHRLISTGIGVYTQTPILRGINDSADTLSTLWNKQAFLGCTPYYAFIERPTGMSFVFESPIINILDIFSTAYSRLVGIARTIRGPVMSTYVGKIQINGVVEIDGVKYFILSYIRVRNGIDVNKPRLAHFSRSAKWINDLIFV